MLQAQTKWGGRTNACACTTKLNAMAAVTTASTKRLVSVTGLVIGIPISSAAVNRLCWGWLMLKLDIGLISSNVASEAAHG